MLNGYALNSQALNSALTGISWNIEFDEDIVFSSSAEARVGKLVVADAGILFGGDVDGRRGAYLVSSPVINVDVDALFGLQAKIVVNFDVIFPTQIAEYVVAAKTILLDRQFISAHCFPDIEYHDYRYTGGEATISVEAVSNLHGLPGSPVDGQPAAEFTVPAEVRHWKVPARNREMGESQCLA